MRATVTVISTCYNQQDLISEAIQSVRKQETDADVFHVIADDGSTDDSVKVLEDWHRIDPRISIVQCTNRNYAGAFNAALLNTRPETRYVITLPGDDWLAPNYIDECLRVVGGADVVVTGMRRHDYPGSSGELEMPPRKQPSRDELWQWDKTYAWATAFIRKASLLATGGFHQTTEGDCDWDMWIDLESRGCKFMFTDKTWYYYRHVPTSLNRVKTKEIWDEHRREMMRHHKRDTMPGPEFS